MHTQLPTSNCILWMHAVHSVLQSQGFEGSADKVTTDLSNHSLAGSPMHAPQTRHRTPTPQVRSCSIPNNAAPQELKTPCGTP